MFTEQELSRKTVIELRRLAKENGVTLGVGLLKQDIVNKLAAALGDEEEQMSFEPVGAFASAAQATPEPAQEEKADQPDEDEEEEADTEPEEEQEEKQEPPAPVNAVEDTEPQRSAPVRPQGSFRPAYQAPPIVPRFNTKPAYQAPAYSARRDSRTSMGGLESPRMQTTRPSNGYTPRFGPDAQESRPQPRQEEENRPSWRMETPRYQRSTYDQSRSAYDAPRAASYEPQKPAYDQPRGYNDAPRPSYEPQPRNEGAYEPAEIQPSRGYAPRPSYSSRRENGYYSQPDNSAAAPQLNDLLAAADCPSGSGVLELHPDGYGFLRGDTLMPSSRDIYVSAAQVRRFNLRNGDQVSGKVRPMRDGDKYAAMLYINEINGCPAEPPISRPAFDELTASYPVRRICLEEKEGEKHPDMRIVDLIAPIGFGQRGLIECPPHCGRTTLLIHLANAISRNHPDAEVMMLLLNKTPEDVTLLREQVPCTVYASTFDQSPEAQLRLSDLVLERAERQVEQKKDVVLLVDSLTTITKLYPSGAPQQNRQMTGMTNLNSLQKAKRLFGAARCTREAGSLTVLATMNIETGNKVDDSLVEEFRGAANMELLLDSSVARANVYPAINLQVSGTRRGENIMEPAQVEGLKLLRGMLGSLRSVAAIPQLLSMMEMASTNEELLVKMKDWAALMNK